MRGVSIGDWGFVQATEMLFIGSTCFVRFGRGDAGSDGGSCSTAGVATESAIDQRVCGGVYVEVVARRARRRVELSTLTPLLGIVFARSSIVYIPFMGPRSL